MKKFTFSGNATISRKFKIEVFASDAEKAEEKALHYLKDTEEPEFYQFGNDEVTIDISEMEEEMVPVRI